MPAYDSSVRHRKYSAFGAQTGRSVSLEQHAVGLSPLVMLHLT